jgi:hypothetical protein
MYTSCPYQSYIDALSDHQRNSKTFPWLSAANKTDLQWLWLRSPAVILVSKSANASRPYGRPVPPAQPYKTGTKLRYRQTHGKTNTPIWEIIQRRVTVSHHPLAYCNSMLTERFSNIFGRLRFRTESLVEKSTVRIYWTEINKFIWWTWTCGSLTGWWRMAQRDSGAYATVRCRYKEKFEHDRQVSWLITIENAGYIACWYSFENRKEAEEMLIAGFKKQSWSDRMAGNACMISKGSNVVVWYDEM